MSDTEPEVQSENPTPDAEIVSAQQPDPASAPDPDVETEKKCPIPGTCRRGIHLPLILSIIAILLAGYAIATSLLHAPAPVVRSNNHFKTLNTTVNKLGSEIDRINGRLNELGQNVQKINGRLDELGQNVQKINGRLNELGQNVQTNKDNLVQSRLKKLLLNIKEIAAMAKTETRNKISKVEDMLNAMTSSGQKTGESPDEERKVAAPPSETTTVEKQKPGDTPASNPAISPEDKGPNTPRSAETF